MNALAWVSGFIACYAIMADQQTWMLISIILLVAFAFLDYALTVSCNMESEGNR